jgi:hypothetical protein
VDAILWDPVNKTIETDMLNGFDAVIHLAGESIADGRWSDAKKKRIRQSRVDATRFLADTLSRLKNPPKTFVSSSAIGFYGDRGNQTVDETSAPGQSFLAQVCQEWENATSSLQKTGSRVVFVRTGIVLAKNGGALGKMLFPFKMGVGGILVRSGRLMVTTSAGGAKAGSGAVAATMVALPLLSAASSAPKAKAVGGGATAAGAPWRGMTTCPCGACGCWGTYTCPCGACGCWGTYTCPCGTCGAWGTTTCPCGAWGTTGTARGSSERGTAVPGPGP